LTCDEQHHPAAAAQANDWPLTDSCIVDAARAVPGLVNTLKTLAEIVDSTMPGDRRT
jgi:hypothetical protein